MADPNFRLQKGKLIDTQQGFTDAFNFVYENLHGLKGGQGVDIDKSLDGAWQINADENAGENEGGGNGAGVYDVIEDSQEDRDGITIQYTDDRADSFRPFP